MERKMVAIVTAIGLLLVTALLWLGKLQSHDYTIAFGIILSTALLLIALDRLKEFDLRNLKLVLSEVKQVQADIYARAATLRSLAENIADITTTFLTDRIPQLMESHLRNERYDRERQRLLMRDRVLSILRESGSSPEKIAQTKRDIDKMIKKKLAGVFQMFLHSYAYRHVQEREIKFNQSLGEKRSIALKDDRSALPALEQEYTEYVPCIRELYAYVGREHFQGLADSAVCDPVAAEQYLRAKDIWDDTIREHIETFSALLSEIRYETLS